MVVQQYPWSSVQGIQDYSWCVTRIDSVGGACIVYADIDGNYSNMHADSFIDGFEWY